MTDRSESGVTSPLSAAKRALLEQRMRGDLPTHGRDTGIRPRAHGAPGVLSPGQRRLWFLSRLEPDSRAYTMAQAWRLRGPLDSASLEAALNEVISRHDVLRTRFDEEDGLPVPVVASKLELRSAAIAVSGAVAAEREAQAARLAATEVRRPFDLAAGPLIRAALLQLANDEHVFIIALHHIVCDEWSLEILWRELATLYADASASHPASIAPVHLHYSDYAAWQRSGESVSAPHLEYWRTRLAGELAPLSLPFDHPRPPRQRFRGGLESLEITNDIAASLSALARSRGVTNFVLLLTAFEVLLHRYTERTDIVVGAPVTGRVRPELEGIIGFFLNSLVLRTDFSGDPVFIDAVARVQDTVLEAMAHQDVPFETLVEELRPERGLSHNPLFQVMFVMQRQPEPPRFAPGLEAQPYRVESAAAKLDLTLFATERADGLELTIEYDSDLFEAATARRMLEHMRVLLEAIAREPDRRIADLPLSSESERRQMLIDWNTAPARDPTSTPVHHLIRRQAGHMPDAIAIEAGTDHLTYSELCERAGALARELRRAGIGPDVCVGICMDRSPAMLVGILGVLDAGGAYVPIDPAYPAQRRQFVLDDTNARVLITGPGGTADTAVGMKVIAIDVLGRIEGNAQVPHEPPAGGAGDDSVIAAVSPDHLAYVIHTSGSTGRPKGVAVSHGNLGFSTGARLQYYGQTPARFLLLPSFAFDSSVAGIFWTLCGGGTLVLPPARIEQDVTALAELIAQHGVTHILCLPSVYAALLEHAPAARLETLRVVICAGEPLPPALARQHSAVLPTAALYNEYGPTEATVWCTVFRVPPDFTGVRVPIGGPIPGARVYVLDPRGRPVPIGVPGELHVGGDGVARGYLGRAEETAARFVRDAFSATGQRLYRTGDRVRWRSDGNLEFLGRTDQQLKLRGYRIEPAEIEAALREHPSVRECVVAVRAGTPVDPAGEGGFDDDDMLIHALLALGVEEADRLIGEVENTSSAAEARS